MIAGMYIDYALVAVSAVFGIVGLILVLRLILTRGRTKEYKAAVTETAGGLETIDIVTQITGSVRARNETVLAGGNTTRQADETEVIWGGIAGDMTVPLDNSVSKGAVNTFAGLDITALEGKYIIEAELGGGGMSRVFLARSAKLGNRWVIKYIEKSTAQLANEQDILKKLNHINLPSIIDIFHDEHGVFIVQSYIEGASLGEIMAAGKGISAAAAVEWMEELARVLDYLHSQTPYPIIHCDLKPSNIMITGDSKLVVIDFGISKLHGKDSDKSAALTMRYAAPEQFKHAINSKTAPFIKERFGTLPADIANWDIDNRTDIYSLGLIFFELLCGESLNSGNIHTIRRCASQDLADIVLRCVRIDPEERFGSVKELLSRLTALKGKRTTMVRSLAMRRVSLFLSLAFLALSSVMLTGGVYIMRNENQALVFLSADTLVLSEQQVTDIQIQKILPGSVAKDIEPSHIVWTSSGGGIAGIDGNRVSGLNEGETELIGRYRNKQISLAVKVVKPVNGLVEVSLRYKKGGRVDTFAGSGTRESADGSLAEASFVSPESIDSDGTRVFAADSGAIRVIEDGMVYTYDFEPSYILADKVRCENEDLYVLTKEWEEDERKYYGILRLNPSGAELVYIADAVYTRIEDFAVTPEKLYFIEYNAGIREKSLVSVNLTSGEIYSHTALAEGTRAMCIDDDFIYLADAERAVIERYSLAENSMTYIAGIEGERHFIDGSAPYLYEPARIRIYGGKLYVLDFNVLRMIDISDVARGSETLAGEVSVELNPDTVNGEAEAVVFAHSLLMDFVIHNDRILLTDPKKSVIREIIPAEWEIGYAR